VADSENQPDMAEVFGTEPTAEQLRDHPIKPRLVPMEAPRGSPPESRIGERIKHARDDLKLSAEALSRYTELVDTFEGRGIGAVTLIRYERGETAPSARELRVLVDALNVPPLWLLWGKVGNVGRSEAEQALMMAIQGYVDERAAAAARSESGTARIREMFDPLSDSNRLRMIREAKEARPRTPRSSGGKD
jgi:transcriptional regulator with XRE-family HTH domain